MLDKTQVKGLVPFATTTQIKYIKAFLKHGTIIKAAKALNKAPSTVQEHIARARKDAAKRGYAPEFGNKVVVPEGYHVKGISKLVDKDGNTKMEWVKSDRNKENLIEDMQELFESVCARIESTAKPVKMPDVVDRAKDMAVVVPMGDPHVGMYAWALEAEADFDCEIAEKLLVGAIEHLVDVSPEAEEFVLINLGDFFHSDNSGSTTTAGTQVDVDGRWAKVQEIGFWIMIKCINRALTKYPHITVHNAIGNHDEHTSQALGATLGAWYRKEPRVTIIQNPSRFWYYRWGKTMIGVHHGHSTTPQAMPLAMASHQPKMWGDTLFRYCYLGHKHHKFCKEYPGATIEQFRTLAPKDAWHFGNANYISMRDMQSIHIHKLYGEVGRRTCPLEYLEKTQS
jgi:hypothetical protein